MPDLPNPHDRFFKELFSQLDTVTDFVKRYLPEHFVALQRFGILGAELDERIRSLSTEQLENLIEALRLFTSKDELLTWLDKEMKSEAQS